MNDKEVLFKAGQLLKEYHEELKALRASASAPKQISYLEFQIKAIPDAMFLLGSATGRLSLRDTMTPEQLAEFDAQQDRP